MVNRNLSVPAVAFLLALSLAAETAPSKLAKGIALPQEFPAAQNQAVEPQGVRIGGESGPYVEIWLSRALSSDGQAADDKLYTSIPDGSFLGVWRFAVAGTDFRGQNVKPGFYSMRYALMPSDGNHLGASQYRDFVLLVPVTVDTKPDAPLKFEEVVALSRKASGTGHPAVFPLVTPENVSEAVLATTDQKSLILKTKINTKSGATPIAITIHGRAEH